MTKTYERNLNGNITKLNFDMTQEFTQKLNGLRYDLEQAINIPNAVDISLANDEEGKKVAKRKLIHTCLGDYMVEFKKKLMEDITDCNDRVFRFKGSLETLDATMR